MNQGDDIREDNMALFAGRSVAIEMRHAISNADEFWVSIIGEEHCQDGSQGNFEPPERLFSGIFSQRKFQLLAPLANFVFLSSGRIRVLKAKQTSGSREQD